MISSHCWQLPEFYCFSVNCEWCVRSINCSRNVNGENSIGGRNATVRWANTFFVLSYVQTKIWLCIVSCWCRNVMSHIKNHAKPIDPVQRLGSALRFLPIANSFSSIAHSYQQSNKFKVSTIIDEVCNALWKILQLMYLEEPTEDKYSSISRDFLKMLNFANCIGAIDVKYVSLPVSFHVVWSVALYILSLFIAGSKEVR